VNNKICSKCKIKKPLEGFYEKKTSRDGYENQCKSCRIQGMNGVRNNRCIDAPLVAVKNCGSCKETKVASQFFKQRKNHDGLDTICKSCFADIDHKRNNTDSRREKQRVAQNERRKELQSLWVEYFVQKYGLEPHCQVCDKELVWLDKVQTNTVIFDHRHGGIEAIQGSPAHWLSQNRPSNENISIWESCDFGILCDKCNRFLPTNNREDWLQNVNRYIFNGVYNDS
jgi:hypothetical protein